MAPFGTGYAILVAMNISVIAFGAMTGVVILFMAVMFLTERNSRPVDFPKSDIAEPEDDNPFKTPCP